MTLDGAPYAGEARPDLDGLLTVSPASPSPSDSEGTLKVCRTESISESQVNVLLSEHWAESSLYLCPKRPCCMKPTIPELGHMLYPWPTVRKKS